MKPKLKSTKPETPTTAIVAARFNREERRKLESMAKEWTGGNLSEWIRYCALHFKPRKRDLQ